MSFLLLENGSKLLTEDGDGILLDIDFKDVSQLNAGDMICVLSEDFGSMIGVLSNDIGKMTVLTDG